MARLFYHDKPSHCTGMADQDADEAAWILHRCAFDVHSKNTLWKRGLHGTGFPIPLPTAPDASLHVPTRSLWPLFQSHLRHSHKSRHAANIKDTKGRGGERTALGSDQVNRTATRSIYCQTTCWTKYMPHCSVLSQCSALLRSNKISAKVQTPCRSTRLELGPEVFSSSCLLLPAAMSGPPDPEGCRSLPWNVQLCLLRSVWRGQETRQYLNTIWLTQWDTFPLYKVDQVVECGLWIVGPLLSKVAGYLHEQEHAVVWSHPEHSKLNLWVTYSVSWLAMQELRCLAVLYCQRGKECNSFWPRSFCADTFAIPHPSVGSESRSDRIELQ